MCYVKPAGHSEIVTTADGPLRIHLLLGAEPRGPAGPTVTSAADKVCLQRERERESVCVRSQRQVNNDVATTWPKQISRYGGADLPQTETECKI